MCFPCPTIYNPFKYLLTYKFSQDRLELLFSCIRSKGGWNNNPNVLQLKYAIRNMLLTCMQKLLKSRFKNVLSPFDRCLNLDMHIYWNSRSLNFTLFGYVVLNKRCLQTRKNIFPERIFPLTIDIAPCSDLARYDAGHKLHACLEVKTRVSGSQIWLQILVPFYAKVAFQLYSVH